VLLHELGHALTARRFGCRTHEILLLPIGGIARIERMPDRPLHELLIAVAGPAVNVVIAGVLLGAAAIIGAPLAATSLLVQLAAINAALAAFNLIPAFPMDGGRVLRAALTPQLGHARATRVAASTGKLFAVVFAIAGVLYAPMLVLIAAFVWFAAEQESAVTELQVVLSRGRVRDAMKRTGTPVDASTPAEDVAARMLAEGHHELPVVIGGRIAGVVTADDLARALAQQGDVREAGDMRREVAVVESTMPLAAAVEPLERSGVALVVDDGELVGLLTPQQLAAYAAFHPAKRSKWHA
jgi:Zn-dependent protease/predicted transcriptional regulator